MQRSIRVLLPWILILTSCAKKENGAVEAKRMIEDTINLSAIMQSDDPNQVESELDLWLQFYPAEVNRVFPDQATTALGLLSQKYFQSPPEQKAQWTGMMDKLLAMGASPNIFFPYQNQRRGIVHVALEVGDFALVRSLIEKQGTIDPPLLLSCDASASLTERAPAARVKSGAIDLNLQEELSRLTPLHYAVQSVTPDPSFIEYLLLQGAGPDISDKALNLVSPFQMVATNPTLSSIFAKYSGPRIRYEARMNSFINEEIERLPAERKTLLDLAKSYKDVVKKDGFEDVQDINRIIEMCQSQERLNLLGYATQYLLPSTSTRVVQGVKARNDSMKNLMADYGAKICVEGNLSIKDKATQTFREISLKDFLKETLVKHSATATVPVKNYSRALWCEIIKPKAIEGACWTDSVDDTLAPGMDCPAT